MLKHQDTIIIYHLSSRCLLASGASAFLIFLKLQRNRPTTIKQNIRAADDL